MNKEYHQSRIFKCVAVAVTKGTATAMAGAIATATHLKIQLRYLGIRQ